MKRPNIFLTLVLTASVIIIAAASLFEIVSPDLFWHLKMGDDFLFHGLSPFVDHYSFTMPGAPIRGVAWLFQVIITLFFKAFSFNGIVLFRFLSWSLGLFLLNRISNRRQINIFLKILGFSFFLFTVIFHSEPRPELFSLTLELLIILLLSQWTSVRDWKLTGLIGLLLIFWSNFHVSSAIGYVIVGAFLIERGLKAVLKKDASDLKFAILSGIIFVGVGFLNPDLTHPLIAQSKVSPHWVEFITEYASRSFAQLEPPLKIYWIFLLLALPGIFWGNLWAGLIIIGVLAYKSWLMSKLFPHLIVATLPFVLSAFQIYFDKLTVVPRSRWTQVLQGILFSLFVFIFGYDVHKSLVKPLHPLNASFDKIYFPVDVLDFMKSKNSGGKIFNSYGTGGFIIHEGAPKLSVYIDGRTSILYPIEFYDHYTHVMTDGDIFKKESEKYGFDYVLGDTEKPGEIIDTALNSGQFELDYFGLRSALLRRGHSQFPETTKFFLHPECLDERNAAVLIRENQLAQTSLPEGSPLRQFLNLVSIYVAAKDKKALFLHTNPDWPRPEWTASPYVSRLAAELARRQNEWEARYYFLSAIAKPNQDDKIDRAELDCRINKCEKAEAILDTVTKGGLREDHIFRAVQILEQVKALTGYKIFNDERVAKNKVRVKNFFNTHTEPTKPDWCHLRATAKSEVP